jgi:hypothetical protein
MDYRYEAVWNKHTPSQIEEIIAFWSTEHALPVAEDAQERAKQAVVLARDGDDRIIGISTAQARIVPRIGQPMYYYRMYSAPAHRGQRTGFTLVEKTQRILQDFTQAERSPAAIGIVLEIENAEYRERYPQAAWPMGFNFIGYSPRSLPIYAYYFPEAKLLPPSRR